MRKLFSVLYLLLSLSVLSQLSACSGKPDTGPGKVRWDREICTRCAMALSDRHYAAQVRGGPVGQKSKLYKFDDIGCAVIWLDEQKWKDNPAVEIWVNDYRNGKWLDARKAWYVTGKTTPMDYALGAQPEKTEGALDFAQAKKHVYEVEKRLNLHSGLPVNQPLPETSEEKAK